MGQYFKWVNITKKETIDTDSGLKLWEHCANDGVRLLAWLCAKGPQDGTGMQSFRIDHSLDSKSKAWEKQLSRITKEGNDPIGTIYKTAGRWAGDQIVLAGDYDHDYIYPYEGGECGHADWVHNDSDGQVRKDNLYHYAHLHFTDITKQVIPEFNEFMGEESLKLGKKEMRAIRPDLVLTAEPEKPKVDLPDDGLQAARDEAFRGMA